MRTGAWLPRCAWHHPLTFCSNSGKLQCVVCRALDAAAQLCITTSFMQAHLLCAPCEAHKWAELSSELRGKAEALAVVR